MTSNLLFVCFFPQWLGATALHIVTEQWADAPHPWLLDDDALPPSSPNNSAKQGPTKWPWERALNDLRDAIILERGARSPQRPERDQWEQRFAAVIGRPSGDPCAAEVLIGGFNWPSGFFSRVSLVTIELGMAMYYNKSAALCIGSTGVGDIWKQYYSPPPMAECLESMCDERFQQARAGNELARSLFSEDPDYFLDFKKFIYDRMFTLKPSTTDSIKRQWGEMGFSGNHIGVHVRHGDKSSEARPLSFGVYASAVGDAQQPHNATDAVYIASDDGNAGREMQALLTPARSTCKVYYRSDPHADSRTYGGDTFLPLLADFEALRTSGLFIGTQSSNLGRYVFFARGREKGSRSLDGEWGSFTWL